MVDPVNVLVPIPLSMDADNEGFISHNMDDEYVGGQWINGEYFFEEKVQKPSQSREDAIYGVFSEGFVKAPRQASGRNSGKDLFGGMRFVSAGVIQGDLKEEEERAAKAKAGTTSGNIHPSRLAQVTVPEPEEDQPASTTTSKFAAKSQAKAKRKKVEAMDKDFGKFEATGTGFGSKMLAKFGFKPGVSGLGKRGEGRLNPIQAATRDSQSLGIGFGSKPKRSLSSKEAEEDDDDDVKDAKKAQKKKEVESNWRKSLKPVKKVYMDAQQLLAANEASNKDSPQVVIDMRGSNVKMTSLNKLHERDEESEDASGTSALPELQHNVRLLVELTESDIFKANREVQHQTDALVPLEHERDRIQNALTVQRDTLTALEDVQHLLEACEAQLTSLSSRPYGERLACIATLLQSLQSRYSRIYREYGLVVLARAMAFPLFQQWLMAWDPLPALPGPSHIHPPTPSPLPTLKQWKFLLEVDAGSEDTWSALVDSLLVPALRLAITSKWQTRHADPMLALLPQLQSVLGLELFLLLLRELVVPRLRQALEEWNPRRDPVPVHTWVLPWAAVVPPELMEGLYAVVRHKLSIVLQLWNPSDPSAQVVIAPWQHSFRESDFERFLVMNILPKLQLCLRTELSVNPLQQVNMASRLLEREFFPKWFQALFDWLALNPDFEEVERWYRGWKSVLPVELQANERIKAMLSRGLDLMNASLDGTPLSTVMEEIRKDLNRASTTRPPSSAAGAAEQSAAREKAAKEAAKREKEREALSRPRVGRSEEMTFRETVERLAEMHGVGFMPSGRVVDGKAVFEFGSHSIYLDKNNVYKLEKAGWRPVSLPDLLTMCGVRLS